MAPRDTRRRGVLLRDLLVVRLVNAWWLVTFFQPDEFFQALEPAWALAFGPGSGAWLTWEWHHQLRSSLHPALFSLAYRLAHAAGRVLPVGGPALRASLLIAAPRALQSFIAALGDWYAWKLAVAIYGPSSNVSFFALFLQLCSPWQWYVSTRTFSNSLETTLTVAALYYWPWDALLGTVTTTPIKDNPKPPRSKASSTSPGPLPPASLLHLRISLSLAALAVILRPTNVLIWLAVAAPALLRAGPSLRALVLAREALLCGVPVLAASLASDRLYFGFWTFPPWRWLTFNVSRALAVFYGRSPWHYYLLQGLPLLCTTSLPFALVGLYRPFAADAGAAGRAAALRTLALAVLTTVGALSLISHKEVRFIYPLLPALNVLAAPWAASFFTSRPAASPSKTPAAAAPRPRLRRKPYLFAALGVNLFLAGYLSILHQPAPLSVLTYLREEYERIHPTAAALGPSHKPPDGDGPDGDELFALFLMPCHSTPWRSHLVYPGLHAYALTCEPPLHTLPNTPERDTYRDEADRFYDDPVGFLRGELLARNGTIRAPPRYIVGFQGVEPWLREFLADTPEGRALGFELRRVWGRFNGLFNEDWRRAGKMLVWDTGVYDNAPPPRKAAPGRHPS